MAQDTQSKVKAAVREWSGFQKGDKADIGLKDGKTYPALLDYSKNALIETTYGEKVRLSYDVNYMKNNGHYGTILVTELADDTFSITGRLMTRLQTINEDTEIVDGMDLGQLHTRGWVLVEIERKGDFPKIVNVSPPIEGMTMPDRSVHGQREIEFENATPQEPTDVPF